jgi:hypothetical protein
VYVQLIGTAAGPFMNVKTLAVRRNRLSVSSNDGLGHARFYGMAQAILR